MTGQIVGAYILGFSLGATLVLVILAMSRVVTTFLKSVFKPPVPKEPVKPKDLDNSYGEGGYRHHWERTQMPDGSYHYIPTFVQMKGDIEEDAKS